MNKLLTKIAVSLLGMSLAVGVGVAVGSNNSRAEETKAADSSYTITFNKTANSDGSLLTTSTASNTIIDDGTDYVTSTPFSSITRTYGPGTGGLKVGISNNNGSVTIALSNSGKVTATSIIVNAKKYSSSTASSLGVNGVTAQALTSDFTDYYFLVNASITTLTITATKYCWVSSIEVFYSSSSGTTTTDTITYSDLAATSTNYTTFNNVAKSSAARYLGSSALNDSVNIQLTNGNKNDVNVGIATSTSGGRIKSISVTYSNANGKKLAVRLSNTAYTSTTFSTNGIKAGDLDASTTSISIGGNYNYVSLVASGATYIQSISFVWEQVSTPTLSVSTNSLYIAKNGTATFVVTATSLTSVFSVTSGNTSYVTVTSISPSASKTDGDYTVTLRGVAVTTSSIDVTVSSSGATSRTVSAQVYEAQEFKKLSNTAELVDSGHYLISKTGSTTIMSSNQGSSADNRGSTDSSGTTPFSTLTTCNNIAAVLVFDKGTGDFSDYYTIKDTVNDEYLYDPNTSGKNYLRLNSSVDEEGPDPYYWSVSFVNGHARIASKNAEKKISFNSNNNGFYSCYANIQTEIDLYLLSSEYSYEPITEITIPSGTISIENYESYTFTANYLPANATETITPSIVTGNVGEVEFGPVNAENGTITVTLTATTAGALTIKLTADTSGTNASKAITVTNSTRIYNSGKLTSSAVSTTVGGSATTNSVKWYTNDFTMKSGNAYVGSNGDKGVQIGKNENDVLDTFELTSELFVGEDYAGNGAHMISSIIVRASTGSGGAATLKVKINGTQVGSTQSLSQTENTYTFTPASNTAGHISICIENDDSTPKAVFIYSIIVKGVTTDGDTEEYYKIARELESIESCDISEEDWIDWLSTESAYFETEYINVFDLSVSEFESIQLWDHSSKDSSSMKTTSYSAYEKYEYINGHVSSSAGLKGVLTNVLGSNSNVVAISVVTLLSVTAIGGYFFLRKKEEKE